MQSLRAPVSSPLESGARSGYECKSWCPLQTGSRQDSAHDNHVMSSGVMPSGERGLLAGGLYKYLGTPCSRTAKDIRAWQLSHEQCILWPCQKLLSHLLRRQGLAGGVYASPGVPSRQAAVRSETLPGAMHLVPHAASSLTKVKLPTCIVFLKTCLVLLTISFPIVYCMGNTHMSKSMLPSRCQMCTLVIGLLLA